VYRKLARYCVLFASADYARKVWTNHERRSAQARALRERSEYVLPARFDDTEIPGLSSTVGYIDLRRSRIAVISTPHFCRPTPPGAISAKRVTRPGRRIA
jgi:hypothetical protein